MEEVLYKTRWKSLIVDVSALLGTAIVGVLTSDVFYALITQYFSETATGAGLLLTVTQVAKHLRNLKVLRDHEKTIGTNQQAKPIILI